MQSPVQRLLPNILNIPKSLTNAGGKHITNLNTFNLYEARIKNPEKPSTESNRIRFLGWEKPGIRIVNSITWLLSNAKEQGLEMRGDGFVRMGEVLNHPQLSNLSFLSVETAIREFRPMHLKLVYAPYDTSYEYVTGTQASCWWIKLEKPTKRKLTVSVDQRIVFRKEVPHMVYRIPTFNWPEFRNRGITRGLGPHISFTNDITVPIDHRGDSTYIRLDSNKVYSTLPLHRSRFLERKRGNKLREIVTTPALAVPPHVFETVMRVALNRIPLLVREKSYPTNREDGREVLNAQPEESALILDQSGIDALRRLGFAHVVEQSQLPVMLQEQQRQQERQGDME